MKPIIIGTCSYDMQAQREIWGKICDNQPFLWMCGMIYHCYRIKVNVFDDVHTGLILSRRKTGIKTFIGMCC